MKTRLVDSPVRHQRNRMKVADLMETDVQVVQEDLTVAEAVVILAEGHIRGLPVVNRRNRMVGVLSTSDVLEGAAECSDAEERNALFERTVVAEVMTSRPKTISPDANVKEAAKQMLELEVHRLFVEHGGELVGVISQSDIVRAVATARI
jgi:CBS domain-containing protein